jgi:hypothetical protein
MAKSKLIDTIEREGRTIAIYDNGMERDVEANRIIKPPAGASFTPETSLEAKKRLAELKREAIMRGAARTLDRDEKWENTNKLDVVEAIAEAVMMKALNPDSAKQVDAARFILQEGGMAETLAKGNESAQQSGDLHVVLMQLATIAQAINNSTTRHDSQVIDAE